MKFTYILFLALKNLRAHKLRTVLTAGGVAISVGFIVFLVSLGLGLQRVSTNQIANLEALQILDVTVAKSKIVNINDETDEKFKSLSNVVDVHSFVSAAAKLNFGSSEIDVVSYGKNADIFDHEDIKLVEGKKYTRKETDAAIVSLAAKEAITKDNIIGKKITLNSIIRADQLGNKEAKSTKLEKEFTVVGVIEDSNAPYIYVPKDYYTDNGVKNFSGAKVIVNDKNNVDTTKKQIENLGFKATSIKETVDQINQFFSMFQLVLMSFGSIAIIVACMGMFNTLTISLLEKTREIGFMKSLGVMKKDIHKIFLTESILIGLIGSILGITSGYALGLVINGSIFSLAKATGNEAIELFYTPLYLILLSLIVATLVSLMTGIYPARRAGRINALDALRYE